jgi:hypothetical protein
MFLATEKVDALASEMRGRIAEHAPSMWAGDDEALFRAPCVAAILEALSAKGTQEVLHPAAAHLQAHTISKRHDRCSTR